MKYDYICSNKACTEHKIVKEYYHKITDPKPHCSICGKQLEAYFSKAPDVKFRGRWMTNGKDY